MKNWCRSLDKNFLKYVYESINQAFVLTKSLAHALLEALGVGDVASEGAKDVAQIKRINVVAFVVLVEDDERIFRLCS